MKIKVFQPFSLRLGSGKPVREFSIGEHAISQEECDHWFMQDCLEPEAEGGRAVLFDEVDNSESDTTAELVAPTKSQLNSLSRDKLDELAVACGIAIPEAANKAVVVDLLLAGNEGVALVKGPDGIYVHKEE